VLNLDPSPPPIIDGCKGSRVLKRPHRPRESAWMRRPKKTLRELRPLDRGLIVYVPLYDIFAFTSSAAQCRSRRKLHENNERGRPVKQPAAPCFPPYVRTIEIDQLKRRRIPLTTFCQRCQRSWRPEGNSGLSLVAISARPTPSGHGARASLQNWGDRLPSPSVAAAIRLTQAECAPFEMANRIRAPCFWFCCYTR